MEFLKKIIPVTISDNRIYKTYHFLCFKIKVKRKRYNAELHNNSILHLWKYAPKNITLKCTRKMLQKPYNKEFNNFIYLVHISCLIESGKFEEAKKEWLEYYKKFGYKNVKKFLTLSKFLCENFEVTDKDVLSCYDFYKTNENNKANYPLEDFFKGKSIAIVGNGPSHIGKNKGKEIDSHDIVIRMNNFVTKGYEKDYGEKTDLWVKNSVAYTEHNRTDILPTTRILYTWDILYNTMDKNYLNQLWYDAKNYKSVCIDCVDIDDAINICKDTPSSGFSISYKIYKILGNFNNVDFYGFSFQDNDTGYVHYYKDYEYFKENFDHNFNLESQILKNLVTK